MADGRMQVKCSGASRTWCARSVALVLGLGLASSCSVSPHCAGCDGGVDRADAGVADGGADNGFDGGTDAGFDGGVDGGFDGGTDAGFDGGADAGFDGGTDAGRAIEATDLQTAFALSLPPNGFSDCQTKIARRGDTVYVLYHSDNMDCGTPLNQPRNGKATIYSKRIGESWRRGATFPFSTGGLLLGPGDLIHVYGYWDGVSACTPFIDRAGLAVYTASGQINQFTMEWAQRPPTPSEPVFAKGRTGGAISRDGTIALQEGLETQVSLWIRPPTGPWRVETPTTMVDALYYYPYVLPLPLHPGAFMSLMQRQDLTSTAFTVNFKSIPTLYPSSPTAWWLHHTFDFRSRGDMDTSTPRDIYQSNSGAIQMLVMEYNPPALTAQELVIPADAGYANPGSTMQWVGSDSSMPATGIMNRLLEVRGVMLHLGVDGANRAVRYRRFGAGGTAWKSIDVSAYLSAARDFNSTYTFISAARAGADDANDYVDILVIGGNRTANSSAAVLSIPAELFVP